MFIPGFGDVSTPQALSATLAGTPTLPRMPYEGVSQTPLSRMQTARARSGILGSLANPLQGQGVPGLTVRDGSTGREITDTAEGADTSTRQAPPYPTVLPPLSPQMLAAIEARRAASLRKLTEAEARADSLRQQAQLANIGRILGIEEETGRERREGMAELAAKGVARSPLFANPFRRELAREQQEKVAESEQTLANTLDKLQATLEAARQQRQTELSQIEFDVGQNRSNVAALLGIA